MGETVTAKSKVFIGGVFTGTPTMADFTAQTWTEIGNVSDLGSWGPQGNEVTATVISDGYTRRLTEAKKAAKLLKDLGKSVTGIAMAPDGGFTVTAVDPGTIAANEPNEWD